MCPLSLVNLYLHGFADPKVEEYDTLTSDDKWGETADVILANPPFMSPKGGIKPHNRFQVASKRSEVLFVDYMAEHLTPNGRAAIVVPEGIIFQGQSAYCELRRMLVEGRYLAAVISLPAGVFNPYSGVKTSILILDRAAAKASASIAFFKVENDGFGLGSQRRAVKGSQLSQVKAELAAWLAAARRGEGEGEGEVLESSIGHAVAKAKIAEGGDFNLTGERYRGDVQQSAHWPMVAIGDLCEIARGASPRPIQDFMTTASDGVNWIKIGDAQMGRKFISKTKEKVSPEGAKKSRYVKPGDFLLSNSMSFGRPYIMATDGCIHDGWLLLRPRANDIDQDYLYHILGSQPVYDQFVRQATGGVVNNLNSSIVAAVQVPFPPLNVQREIVAQIEGYQKVIDGARAVLESYHPRVPVDAAWPMVEIGSCCRLINGRAFKPSDWESEDGGGLPIIRIQNLNSPSANLNYYSGDVKSQFIVEPGELLFSWSGSRGTSFGAHIWNGSKAILNQHIFRVLLDESQTVKSFMLHILNAAVEEVEDNLHGGVGLVHITKGNLEKIKIPLPPLKTQQSIAAEIEAEQTLVAANRELITRFETKVKQAIASVWGGAREAAPKEAVA
ncbi:restriction endonuclease subunit S [Sphingomonas sp. PAMC26645]|uniref:restriction endonuclease subunit S n=1 Tax=Sphingomonas sp. PAMC26645 TaxID=2565555 RepID=UPI001B349759|nr:restriction endonuclease subunit S [Sphingomonas sp. PAMC26645]